MKDSGIRNRNTQALSIAYCQSNPIPQNTHPLVNRLAAICLLLFAAPSLPASDNAGWITLFNGTDLNGWNPKVTGHPLGENPGNLFRVEDGMLRVRYDAPEWKEFRGRNGHLFFDKPFSDYLLLVEYRFLGRRADGTPPNAHRRSAVIIHSQPPETMGRDQSLPVSLNIELLGGDAAGDRSTANLATPGTLVWVNGSPSLGNSFPSVSNTYRGTDWVRVEIEVRGNRLIRHKVFGETVLEYTRPMLDINHEDAAREIERRGGDIDLSGGSIAIQAAGQPVDFRTIKLRPLPPCDPLDK